MAAEKPTPKATLQKAKETYVSWGEYHFQLLGSPTFRPALTEATEKEVVTNVKTYKSYTPKDSLEPMTITVLYDPVLWDELRVKKEAGEVNLMEVSDGFTENALISGMAEVAAEIDGDITNMQITFGFPAEDDEIGG